MKKTVVLLIAFLAIAVSSAQADIKLGVKAGVNLANASFDKEVLALDNFTGFQAGLITEFIIPAVGLGFDASLLYSQRGLKLRKSREDGHLNTLEVPVNLKFKTSFSDMFGAYLATGPYANFSLSDGLSGLKDQFDTKSFGCGWNFGLGVELFSQIQLGVNYRLGLTNDYKYLDQKGFDIDDLKASSRVWSITAAYFF